MSLYDINSELVRKRCENIYYLSLDVTSRVGLSRATHLILRIYARGGAKSEDGDRVTSSSKYQKCNQLYLPPNFAGGFVCLILDDYKNSNKERVIDLLILGSLERAQRCPQTPRRPEVRGICSLHRGSQTASAWHRGAHLVIGGTKPSVSAVRS